MKGGGGMSDYTLHKDRERMKRYEQRHRHKEDWTKQGLQTAGFWSKWLLWNKPHLGDSIADMEITFLFTHKEVWQTPSVVKTTRAAR